jgi:hypothetical protein
MFPVVIDIKGVRYPATAYIVYYHEIDETVYKVHANDSSCSGQGRTLHSAMEQLAMNIIENE